MKKKKCNTCKGTGKVRPPKYTNYSMKLFGITGLSEGWKRCNKCYGTGFKVR